MYVLSLLEANQSFSTTYSKVLDLNFWVRVNHTELEYSTFANTGEVFFKAFPAQCSYLVYDKKI